MSGGAHCGAGGGGEVMGDLTDGMAWVMLVALVAIALLIVAAFALGAWLF